MEALLAGLLLGGFIAIFLIGILRVEFHYAKFLAGILLVLGALLGIIVEYL